MAYKDKEKQKARQREYYLANRNEIIARSIKWRKNNPAKYLEWWKINKGRYKKTSRAWYEKNKQKVIEQVRQWRKEHPEKRIDQGYRYRQKHKEQIKIKSVLYRAEHKLRDSKIGEERRRALKLEVFIAYGRECVCCGEENIGFLTIDHINNDGNAHRKQVQPGAALYRWLKKNCFPKDRFRILCWNCNIGRYHNRGICPHDQVTKC